MSVRKLCALANGGLLLFLVQTGLAADQRAKMFQDAWEGFGQLAEKEAANLSAKGRAAFQKALVACSLYVDDYDNAKYMTECERAAKLFSVEFAENRSFHKCVSGGRGVYMAPNGSFTAGQPQMAPNGAFVGGQGPMTMCADGSYVRGQCQMMPNGRFIGR